MARKLGEKNHYPTVKYNVTSETVPYSLGPDVKLSGSRKALIEEYNLYCEPFSDVEHAKFLAKRLTRLGINFKIILQEGTMCEGRYHVDKVVPFARYLVLVPYYHETTNDNSNEYKEATTNRQRMRDLRDRRKSTTNNGGLV